MSALFILPVHIVQRGFVMYAVYEGRMVAKWNSPSLVKYSVYVDVV